MCGHIIPESPVVPLGSNFTAYCILYEKCLSQGNAEQIVWRTKNVAVPKEQYHIINETVSSVTFNDTSALTSVLTCNILMKGQLEQTIYGINIQFGCKCFSFLTSSPVGALRNLYRERRNYLGLSFASQLSAQNQRVAFFHQKDDSKGFSRVFL